MGQKIGDNTLGYIISIAVGNVISGYPAGKYITANWFINEWGMLYAKITDIITKEPFANMKLNLVVEFLER